MKPATIISLKHQLMQFFNAYFIEKIARQSNFTYRIRTVHPLSLVLSIIAALSKGNNTAIADIHRQYNGNCLSDKDNVAYKPFHNQLRKPGFAECMRLLTLSAMAQFIQRSVAVAPAKLAIFKEILLHDGSSFCVHNGLKEQLPGRFGKTAAVECHVTMSLLEQLPTAMSVTADTATERTFLPSPALLKDKLLMADAGYVDFHYMEQVALAGGFFLMRGGKALNPVIVSAISGKGKALPHLVGKSVKEVSRKMNRSEVLDLTVQRDNYKFRLIRRWFAAEKRFCLWLTNLPAETFSADDIMSLYRCRWQIELLFKELKSHTNWKKFITRQRPIVEGLIWASLLSLIIRRGIASCSSGDISFFKSAKNVDIWLLPILMALSHRALSEIEVHLTFAFSYLYRNAVKARQKKTGIPNTLDGIRARFNA